MDDDDFGGRRWMARAMGSLSRFRHSMSSVAHNLTGSLDSLGIGLGEFGHSYIKGVELCVNCLSLSNSCIE